ncbi:hypothetical protein H072_714 [Dactylellina haptotyla CBS 200.50]|uniref:Spindle pole body component n=1 Tax=Dactylellina haptotyla (strain CBS 200.50) TaxID=1284197 RepID=S8AR43_DACHA|nr:hypothetical protein H072_714 [Dactylellina haptotyla CBS 200.50]
MANFNPFALPDDLWSLPKSDLLDTLPEESLFNHDIEKLLQLDLSFGAELNPKTETLFPTAPWGELFPPLSLPPRKPPLQSEEVEKSEADSAIAISEDPWLDAASTVSEDQVGIALAEKLTTCADRILSPWQGELISWETFLSDGYCSQTNPFVTEARSHIIDAVIQRHDSPTGEPPKNVIQTDVLIYCLLHLAQGHDSFLFRFNADKMEFEMTRENLRISGASVGATEKVVGKYRKCGNQLRTLQAFAASVYADSSNACKTRVALAACVQIVNVAVQHRLTVVFTDIKSLLQLDDIVNVPALILDALLQIVDKVKSKKLDYQLLSVTFNQIQQSEYQSDWLRKLLLLMLQRITHPWLTMVSKAIGILIEKSAFSDDIFEDEGFFIELEEPSPREGEEEPHIDLVFIPSNIPSFLTLEEAERIYETARGLRLIRRFYPEHPLLVDHSIERHVMRWNFSWEELQAIDLEAATHEKRLQLAMQSFNLNRNSRFRKPSNPSRATGIHRTYEFECFGKTDDEIQTGLATSLSNMNIEPERKFGFEGDTDHSLGNEAFTVEPTQPQRMSSAKYPPPLSITFSLSLNPILQAQARLANMACMRLLFKERNVRNQFELLHSFLLFGDGVYVSRLSASLFSEDLASGATNSGIRSGIAIGGWGLQLGIRTDWPPASSELRLALMGIMTECYAADVGRGKGHKENDDLPGGLSFMVREMSEDEEERCKNPDSLEALDFLQVRYKPQSPFDTVVDAASLVKYDRLFKHLLRIIRMLYVVNQLFGNTNLLRGKKQAAATVHPTVLRFRIEAHFFVSVLAKYMFETGVETVWKEFARKLDEIERRLERYDIADKYGEMESLGQLAAYHNSCLDQMLFATMLRLRQQPVLNLIEEIFAMILKFAKMVRVQQKQGVVDPRTPTDDASFERLYNKFRRRVGIFINVARALSERRGYGGLAKRESDRSKDAVRGPGDAAEGGALGQLLVRLEMSSYYIDAAKKL